jgi:putative methionine-R-sulfoxide reductase with GAF domain
MEDDMHLLIVEDEKNWRENYREIFSQDSTLICRWAKTYKEANDKLQKELFDIIIIDLSLSGKEMQRSFEGIRLVQELSALFMPPIVIVGTGYSERVQKDPDFPIDFVFDVFEKNKDSLSKLRESVKRAQKIKRVQKLIASTGKYVSSSLSIIGELKKTLKQLVSITDAYACHILFPSEDREYLEIAVSTENKEGSQIKIGSSMFGEVFNTRKLINISDTQIIPKDYNILTTKKKVMSELVVPLLVDSRIIGVLNISSLQQNAFGRQHEELLTSLAGFIVATLQSDHERLDLKELLGETTKHLLESVIDLDQVFEAILDRGCKLVMANMGFVTLIDEDHMITKATTNEDVWPIGSILGISDSICGQAVLRGYILNVRDITKEPYSNFSKSALGDNLRSTLVVPLRLEDEVIGALSFESPELGAFTSEDQRILVALASQASTAIRITKDLERRRLSERSKTIADLAAGLSHNVRSPADGIRFDLTQIQNKYSQLLQDNQKLREYLDRIERAAIKIQGVPQQIAERIEQYKPQILMNCQLLIIKRVETMRSKDQIPVEVKLQIDKSIQEKTEFLAYEETPMIVDNLILNAIQAMGGKGIMRITKTIKNNCVEFLFEDSGCGIPPLLREIVFDRDYASSEYGGVGLWWVKKHLSRLGATIDIGESSLGGAKFIVRFPLSTK